MPVALLLLGSVAGAQETISWQPTLQSAKQIAAETNRLVLIHFWADWCVPCKRMEREIFSQPAVAAVVNRHYVPVKINRDHFPATCRRYGVTGLPTDIIITPQDKVVGHIKGLVQARDYMARLDHISAGRRREALAGNPQVPSPRTGPHAPNQPLGTVNYQGAPGPPDYSPSPPGSNVQGYPTTVPPTLPSTLPAARQQVRQVQPRPPGIHSTEPVQVARAQVAPGQPPVQRSSANPPLGLDGFCPVQLNDDMHQRKMQWTRGDPRWGVVHRGRTYLFSGLDQQRRFLSDPDRYAPVLSGNDIVLAIDQGQMVPGRREHGVLFENRVYLFASETTLGVFAKNRSHYANRAMQAMRDDAARQHGMR